MWMQTSERSAPPGVVREDSTCVCMLCSVVFNSLRPHGLWPTRLLCPWDFPRKNTGVSCHFHLQNFPLAIYFTYDNVYVSTLLSQLVLPSPSPLCPKSVFYMCLCSRPANRYHFYRFHKYVLIYICFPLTSLCNRF